MDDKPIPEAPYVGPVPFERTAEDRARFFGREEETAEIVSLVMGYSAVLIYAQSGAGKTSLFNASIAPGLETADFEVLPLTRVKQVVPAIADTADVANLYMFCALLSWVDNDEPAAPANTSLANYLAQRPRLTTSTGRPKRRVIIFDQLEELFGFYPPDWRKQQGDFFQQIADAQAADSSLRVVFIIREDYLAQLDPFASLLPEQLSVRFRLEPLRREQALLAVEKPLEGTACSYAHGVAEELVHELVLTRVLGPDGKPMEVEGEYVEPVQLQVVCQSLWRSLPAGTTEITGEQLQQFGDVNRALGRFYENSLQKAMTASGVSEARLRDWFTTELITPASTRGTVFSGSDDTAGIPNAAVVALDKEHIIRREERAGAGWYELTHDRFIEPIQKSNAEWKAEQDRLQAEIELAEAEQKAEERVRRSRQRALTFGSVLGLVVLAALLFGVTQAGERDAVISTATAVAATTTAESIAATAAAPTAVAISARLVERAGMQMAASDPDLALLLGVAAWSASDTPAARQTLLEALVGYPEPVTEDLPGWGAAEVTAVDFSPDGQKIISADRDGVARVWVAAGGQEPGILRGHESSIWSASFSTDGERIVTASDDGTARVWDAASLDELLSLPAGRTGGVLSASFSPDKARIVTAGCGATDENALCTAGTAKVWDAANGKELLTLSGHEDWVNSARYSPDGARIVTASADGTVKVWDATNGEELLTLTGHDDSALYAYATYSPNGEHIVTASADGTAAVWNAETGVPEGGAFSAHGGPINFAAYSPDGTHIVTASADGTARVWGAATGQVKYVLRHTRGANAAAFSPDGRLLATASEDGSLRVWNAEDGSVATGWDPFPAAIELACRTAGRSLSAEEWNQFVGADVPYRETCADWLP